MPWFAIAQALALGAAGGALAHFAQLPLAWMIGAMATTTAAAVAGVHIEIPKGLRVVMVAVLGVMLGSAFSPEILERAGAWLASLAGLTVYIAVSMAAAIVYFRRVARYDWPTAYFSAAPGGLSEMVMVGAEMGGRIQSISLVHGARIMFVVLILPFAFQWLEGYEPGGTLGGAVGFLELAPRDLAILAGCGLMGYAVARLLRVPAAAVVGPMVASAALHLGGITAAKPPAELTAAAQVVIGSAIGCRFAGTASREIGRTALVALGATLIMLAVTAVMAWLMHLVTGLPPDALVLALAPGGLAEMSLIAIALGVDAAFVSTHHIVRIFLIVVCAAPLFRKVRRRPRLTEHHHQDS